MDGNVKTSRFRSSCKRGYGLSSLEGEVCFSILVTPSSGEAKQAIE